jgi:hypothetical protein
VSTTVETAQRLQALQLANAVYRGHAALKRDVKTGTLSVVEALEDPRARGNLSIAKLLRAQVRWGPRRTQRFCNRVGIFEGRRVDALTERQRRLIATAYAQKTASHHKRRSRPSP